MNNITQEHNFKRGRKIVEKIAEGGINNLTIDSVYKAERIIEKVGHNIYKKNRSGYLVLQNVLYKGSVDIEIKKRQLEKVQLID